MAKNHPNAGVYCQIFSQYITLGPLANFDGETAAIEAILKKYTHV